MDPHFHRSELPPDLANLPPILTTEEVAALFRVCPTTIQRRAREGSLPAIEGLRVGRFTREVVLAALQSGRI